MPYASVYVDSHDVLSAISDEELIAEMKRRGMLLARPPGKLALLEPWSEADELAFHDMMAEARSAARGRDFVNFDIVLDRITRLVAPVNNHFPARETAQ